MIEIVQLLLNRFITNLPSIEQPIFLAFFLWLFWITILCWILPPCAQQSWFYIWSRESGRKSTLTQPWLVQADMPLSRTQSLRNHGTRLRENPKSYCERPLLYFCRFHSTNFTTGSVVAMNSPTTNMVCEKRVNQIISLGRKALIHFLSAWGNLKVDKVGWTYYRP